MSVFRSAGWSSGNLFAYEYDSYSPCDGVILPYTSTRLDGATNNLEVCTTHLGFLTDTPVLREIANYVRA